MPKIRIAAPEDLKDVVLLYKKGLESLGEPYNEESVRNKVYTSYYLAPCFLVIKDDTIVGIAGLTVIRTSHDSAASLADYMFYIEPEYRSIRTLDALMEKIKDFAVSKNLPIRLDFRVSGNIEARERLLNRYGFKVQSVVGVYDGK